MFSDSLGREQLCWMKGEVRVDWQYLVEQFVL